MAYAPLDDLKMYLGIADDSTDDDLLLRDLLERASTNIDSYTHRNFEARTDTEYYERDDLDDSGFVLWLGRDLLTVTTLTNGHAIPTVAPFTNVIPDTEYWLVDAKGKRKSSGPYHAIRLKIDSTYSWEFDVDYWVEVEGTWGYSSSPPDDVVQATIRLASYYYAQKDAQVFDVTAVPEAGVITVPQGIPRDVKVIIDHYKRQGLA